MKISELVKTYKLLNDPNAPNWNVKFVGGIVIALAVVGAGAFTAWSFTKEDGGLDAAPAAATSAEAGDVTTCEPTEVAEEMKRLGTATLPPGHKLPSGCVIG